MRHDRDEAFCFRRRLQAPGHGADGFFGDLAGAECVPAEALADGDIEENGLALAATVFSDFDERATMLGGEVGGVDVGDRRAEGDAVADEIAHEAEDQRVDGLVRRIVAEPETEFVRRDGYAALLGDPGGLAAAGQAHQDDDALLRQR